MLRYYHPNIHVLRMYIHVCVVIIAKINIMVLRVHTCCTHIHAFMQVHLIILYEVYNYNIVNIMPPQILQEK